MSKPPRLTGLDGSPMSYVQFADAPARPDTHRLARRPGWVQFGTPEGRRQRFGGPHCGFRPFIASATVNLMIPGWGRVETVLDPLRSKQDSDGACSRHAP